MAAVWLAIWMHMAMLEGNKGLDMPNKFQYRDMVKQFVVYFYRHIRERNLREIFTMYETSFTKLSERYFKGTTWPPVDAIAHLVEHDHVFCLLYKELYFRHLYASVVQPTVAQRIESWKNYCDLFGLILHGNVNMQLPNGWLYDMVDEFIYQFQSYSQFRGKLAGKGGEEVAALAGQDGVWAVVNVANFLQALIDKSKIVAELTAPGGAERFAETGGYSDRGSNVLRMVGYFSLVGLARVHTLLGDYHSALVALHPINPFQRQHLFTPKNPSCNITLFYHAGFCYLMQRRYLDAAHAFNYILGYISKVKNYQQQRGPQYDQTLRKQEQIYRLLAITLALCPGAARVVDTTVYNTLLEKVGDKFNKMVRGDETSYDELFSYSCPKFIVAAVPAADAPAGNANQEAYRLQARCFLGLLHEQRHLPALKQLLKLYTSIPLPKLASLLDVDAATVRAQLQVLKATSYCKTWAGKGDCTQGELQAAADVDFYIDIDVAKGEEMVIVSDIKPPRRQQTEALLVDISKFEQMVRDLDLPAPVGVSA